MSTVCLKCKGTSLVCNCPKKPLIDPQLPVRAKAGNEMKPRKYVTEERLELLEELSRVSEELVEWEERYDVLQIKREDVLELLRNTP